MPLGYGRAAFADNLAGLGRAEPVRRRKEEKRSVMRYSCSEGERDRCFNCTLFSIFCFIIALPQCVLELLFIAGDCAIIHTTLP